MEVFTESVRHLCCNVKWVCFRLKLDLSIVVEELDRLARCSGWRGIATRSFQGKPDKAESVTSGHF